MRRRIHRLLGPVIGLSVLIMVAAGRSLATPVEAVWKGGTGNWNNSASWVGGVVPNNTGDTTYAVTLDGNAAANSLAVLNINASIADLTVTAGNALSISGTRTLIINSDVSDGIITNAGNISLQGINLSGPVPSIQFTGTRTTLTGGGTITFNGGDPTRIYAIKDGRLAQLINQDQLIQGSGLILAALVNRATIAFGPDSSLSLAANSGTIKATGGGALYLSGALSEQTDNFEGSTGGLIEVDSGGSLYLKTQIRQGTIRVIGNGRIAWQRGGFVDGTLINSNMGLIYFDGSSPTQLTGKVTNPAGGRLEIVGGTQGRPFLLAPNDVQNAGTISLYNAYVDTTSIAPLVGGGSVMLAGSATLTGGTLINQDQIIQGAGIIEASLINRSTLDANKNGNVLKLRGSAKVNDGLFRASNGGILQIRAPISGTGRWEADGGDIWLHDLVAVTSTGPVLVIHSGRVEVLQGAMSGSNLVADDTSSLAIDSTLALSGNLSFATKDHSAWSWGPKSTLGMTGGVGAAVGDWSHWASMEIGGKDLGNAASDGFVDNFDLTELRIGPGAHVYLADLIDNGGRVSGPEAIYVDTLRFADGAGQLDLNGLHIYYKNLIGSEAQIITAAVPEPSAGGILLIAALGLCSRRWS